MLPLSLITYPRIDPIALKIGPLAVHWYGLAYLFGFIACYAVLRQMILRKYLEITLDGLSDLSGWLALGVMLGGRTGWWIFYHRDPGHPEPWYEPFAIWHGGMSFHGGLTGVLLVLVWWCWQHKASIWNVADCLALVTPIGLFFGRLANFINAELVGRPSNVPWAMIFPNDVVARHPSQLYEAALEGPLLMLILWTVWRLSRRCDGQIAACFLLFYGIFRIVVEFTRQPDEQLGFIAFGWLTMGQLLSAIPVIAGIVLYIYRRRQCTVAIVPAD